MLPLDHIPFYHRDPEALARTFERLGFTVSPRSRYTAPDHPATSWRGRCVFMREGWFDMLFAERARQQGAPMSLLFRTDDLAATREALAALNPEEPFRLERSWADDCSLPPERLAYAILRSRIAPFPLAVIEHAWPCVDVLPEWQAHANGAQAVTALIFGGEAPGPAAATAARFLDHEAIEYWPLDAFQAAFRDAPFGRAVRVRVDDLSRTRNALQASGATFLDVADGVAAPAQENLAGGILFSA